MKRIYHLPLFFVLSCTLLFSAFDEVPFLTALKEKLVRHNKKYPEEKIYVQLDKPFYKPGEDIWFNAFLLNRMTHRPSTISDVVYTELIDPKGNVAARLELYQRAGSCRGDFKLAESAAGGLYKIKAYTNWMLNFDSTTIFTKDIQVQRVITPRLLLKLKFEKEAYGAGDEVKANLTVRDLKDEKRKDVPIRFRISLSGKELPSANALTDEDGNATLSFILPDSLHSPDGLLHVVVDDAGVEESISRAIPIVLNKITLQFFPEGGDLVAGIASRVAFKAVNEYGKGADVSGHILDDAKNVIAEFGSYHMGMGAFTFTPQRDKKYYAQLLRPASNAPLLLLPPSRQEGYVFHVSERTADEIVFRIHSPVTTESYIVGQVRGTIHEGRKVNLRAGVNTIRMNITSFPAGIATFTLFDSGGAEQCERLVFINAQKQMNIRLTTDKKKYSPGERVKIDIETTDDKGDPLPGQIALSIVDDQLISFSDDKQDNILSHMLLSSELKGKIQEPAFYFNKEEQKATQALDYLLMTQGWRRFVWKELTAERTLTYLPEKEGIVSGTLTGRAEITLLELGEKRRVAQVKTTPDGQFIFKNVDPTVPVFLATRKPHKILITKGRTLPISKLHGSNVGSKMKALREETFAIDPVTVLPVEPNRAVGSGELDLSMTEDVRQLSEVVVTGYGAEEKSYYTGSIVSLRSSELDVLPSFTSLEGLLQGRIAGIQVQTQNASPGSNATIRIRGINSLGNGRNEPLYIINGQPLDQSSNDNFSIGSIVSPGDIDRIEVLKSAEASALFGSRASNGVILITTRSRISIPYVNGVTGRKKESRYNHVTVFPRAFSATREFYTPPPKGRKTDERQDFRTTLYWNANILTDEKGKAQISFYNNDAVTAFRITSEGISNKGLIGKQEETYYTTLPVSIDAKLPEFMSYEDTVMIPVRMKNTSDEEWKGTLTLTLPDELTATQSKLPVTLPAEATQTAYFSVTARGVAGTYPVRLQLSGKGYEDEVKQSIRVFPVGFPMHQSFSGREMERVLPFTISDAERGTLRAEFNAFPDVISDLFTGAESILHEPYGCFEQVSSSTFPNILALQFLQRSGELRPETEKKALNFIRSGYTKLMAYEIKGGGFEWFGTPAAHEALSAYGLIEFHEMKKVFSSVDEGMMNRTRQWLLSRKNGKGGFLQNHGKYGFSSAAYEVNNAYIVYALAETGTSLREMENEYQHVLAEAWNSKDMYRMALACIAAFDFNQQQDYKRLVSYFQTELESSGAAMLKADHSIVWSGGISLKNEVMGLWAIALAKKSTENLNVLKACVDYLTSHRSYGGFGSTQATTIGLQALTAYANVIHSSQEGGEIQLSVNGSLAENRVYQKGTKDKLVMKHFAENLYQDGAQTIRVSFHQTTQPLPYAVDIYWNSKTPLTNTDCKVMINAAMNKSVVKVNETARLTIQLTNRTSAGMTMAVIGIPAGLSVQPWQLKELQERGLFDFYEIIGDRIAFYYRELKPSAQQTILLDLKAEIPGTFQGAANTAYLYYTNESKDWKKGLKITVIK